MPEASVQPDYLYRITDEPKSGDAPVDYAYLYSVVRELRDIQGAHIEKVDGKAATIIAGILAAIGFSLDHVQTWYQIVAVLLYGIPLAYLYVSYRVSGWGDSPSPWAFAEKFPWYPKTTLATAIGAIAEESRLNQGRLERKARQLNRGFATALLVTFVVIITRVIAQLYGAPGQAVEGPPPSKPSTSHAISIPHQP